MAIFARSRASDGTSERWPQPDLPGMCTDGPKVTQLGHSEIRVTDAALDAAQPFGNRPALPFVLSLPAINIFRHGEGWRCLCGWRAG
jgi:hypothetical protein